MNKLSETNTQSRNQAIFWTIFGGIFSLLFLVVFSYLQADSSLRTKPLLVFVTVAGAAAALFVYRLNLSGRFQHHRKRLAFLVNIVLYSFLVTTGFLLARMGPF